MALEQVMIGKRLQRSSVGGDTGTGDADPVNMALVSRPAGAGLLVNGGTGSYAGKPLRCSLQAAHPAMAVSVTNVQYVSVPKERWGWRCTSAWLGAACRRKAAIRAVPPCWPAARTRARILGDSDIGAGTSIIQLKRSCWLQGRGKGSRQLEAGNRADGRVRIERWQ